MLYDNKIFAHKRYQSFILDNRLSRCTFKLTWISLSIISAIWVGQQLYNPLRFPIRHLKVLGSGAVEVNAVLRKSTSISDISALRAQLEQRSALEQVTLWRLLPSTLLIHSYAREPIAVFQSDKATVASSKYFMDKTGVVFQSEMPVVSTDLPKLIGSADHANRLLLCYRTLNALLTPQALKIEILRLDTENRLYIALSNGMQLLLGHLDPGMQLQRLLDVHPGVLHRADKIAILDLRYPNGMAITWRPA